MSTPKISVVIPNYNRVGRLETAIESVLSQDFEAMELIVVDDGSSDETPALLSRIAERESPERFRVIHQQNAGQSAALTRGWNEARADLLSYLNNDDYLLPGALEELVRAAELHPEAELIYPLFQHVDERGMALDQSQPIEATLLDQFRNWACYPGVALTIRRETYERLGGWNEQNWRCPDFEWFLRAGDLKYHVIPVVLGAWRMHDGSITVSQGGDEVARVRAWLELWEELLEPGVLPDEVREHADEALGNLLISAGLAVGEQRRFAVYDRLVASLSQQGARNAVRHASAVQQQTAVLLSELSTRRTVDEHRVKEIESLRATIQHDALTIATLRDQLARAEAALEHDPTRERRPAATDAPEQPTPAALHPGGRPRWIAIGRALTPPPLRPPVGAAVHRRLYG